MIDKEYPRPNRIDHGKDDILNEYAFDSDEFHDDDKDDKCTTRFDPIYENQLKDRE